MTAARNASFAVLMGLTTAGCTIVQDFPTESRVGVGDVANRIQCQLRDVVNGIGIAAFKQEWSAGFTLELKAERKVEGSVKPFSWTVPGATTLKLGAEAAGSRDAVRKIVTEYQFNLVDLDDLKCAAPAAPYRPGAGETLFEAVVDYVSDFYSKGIIGTEKKPSVSYEVTFTVQHSASAGPTIELVNFSTGVSAGGSRTDIDKMTATFVKNPAPVSRGSVVPQFTSRQIQQNLDELITPKVRIIPENAF